MMHRNRRFGFLMAVAVLLAATGCPESDVLDDGDSSPTVFEIRVLTSPSVTGAIQPGGGCAFTVTDWSASADNKPKTANAGTSPFNDIELRDLTIQYTCDVGLPCPPTRTFGITGTVPAAGSVSFTFPPIHLQDVAIGLASSTIALDMTFTAVNISGEVLTYRTGDPLGIGACI